MCFKLKDWKLSPQEPRDDTKYMLRGCLLGIPICIRNIQKLEYIRIGIIAHWGCISFICVYGEGLKYILEAEGTKVNRAFSKKLSGFFFANSLK